MSIQGITSAVSGQACRSKKLINKKLTQMPEQCVISQQKNKDTLIKAEGSCGGLVSWSLNTAPNQSTKKKIKAEGSCGGLVSWSLNQAPVQTKKEIKMADSCGGLVSWSNNAAPVQKWLKGHIIGES